MGQDDATVDGMFRAAAARFPHRPFLRYIDGELDSITTYAEALVQVALIVQRLQEAGLGPGDRVVTYGDELVPSIYFSLAAAHASVLHAPIGPAFSRDVVEDTADRIGAKAIVCMPATHRSFTSERYRVLSGALPLASETMKPEEAQALLERVASTHGPDDLYMLQPTSGSTGKSKLVLRVHRTFARWARLETEVEMGGFKPSDEPPQRYLLVAALTHGMGQYLLASACHAAATLVVPRQIGLATRLEDVRRLAPTLIGIPPRVLKSLFEQYKQSDRVQRRLAHAPGSLSPRVGRQAASRCHRSPVRPG
jgi:acyl-coenzyme A synthetase/AMP-(fatty) acid ligase